MIVWDKTAFIYLLFAWICFFNPVNSSGQLNQSKSPTINQSPWNPSQVVGFEKEYDNHLKKLDQNNQHSNSSRSESDADKIYKKQNSNNHHYNPIVIPPADIALRHQFIKSQAAKTVLTDKENQLKIIQDLLNEDKIDDKVNPVKKNRTQDQKYLDCKRSFSEAYQMLLKMKQGKILYSLKDAVFIVENAYGVKTLSYSEYSKRIKEKVELCKTILKEKKISQANQIGLNYVIQKLFSEKIIRYKDSVKTIISPYKYDHIDFIGRKDLTKLFVTKLLKTGSGQCHSMPLLYMIIAEELNAKAYISYVPEHSFIRFTDKMGKLYNFEATNGHLVSDKWLMASGYINTMALKSKIYLDTIGQKRLLNQCLSDLIIYYTAAAGYDMLTERMIKTLLEWDANNLAGNIFQSDLAFLKLKRQATKYSNPKVEEFPSYPELEKSYKELTAIYDYIDNLGYQAMTVEEYDNWLRSLNEPKYKTENKNLHQQVTSTIGKQN